MSLFTLEFIGHFTEGPHMGEEFLGFASWHGEGDILYQTGQVGRFAIFGAVPFVDDSPVSIEVGGGGSLLVPSQSAMWMGGRTWYFIDNTFPSDLHHQVLIDPTGVVGMSFWGMGEPVSTALDTDMVFRSRGPLFTPEPGTLSLLVLGVALVALARWLRRGV